LKPRHPAAPQNGITEVADASATRHTSAAALGFASVLREFIRTRSKLPVWDKTATPSQGFWRLLLVREVRGGTRARVRGEARGSGFSTNPPRPARAFRSV
jgi:hypothetical protein